MNWPVALTCLGVPRSTEGPVQPDRGVGIVPVRVAPEVGTVKRASLPERRLRPAERDLLNRADLAAVVVVDRVLSLRHDSNIHSNLARRQASPITSRTRSRDCCDGTYCVVSALSLSVGATVCIPDALPPDYPR
jgi:hypothetical protein